MRETKQRYVCSYAWKNCNLGEYSAIYHYKLFSDQKKSNMTLERIKLLKAIGFTWFVSEEKWLAKYNELTEYKKLTK